MLPEKTELMAYEVCDRWREKYGDCTLSMIKDYVRRGLLTGKTRLEERHFSGQIISNENQVFTLEEVKRFEEEHCKGQHKELNQVNVKDGLPLKESTRSIEMLQKMLIALSIDGYKYDPKSKNNGEALKDMREAFDNIGLDVCDNTIRKHLKAGALLIPQE